MVQDKTAEIQQGERIVDYAASAWNWATPAGKRRASRRAEYLKELGALDSSKKVLEVGCGIGIFTKELASTGARIVAIDISPHLIERAKRDVKDDNIEFKICDVDNLPFKNEEFDVVLGTNVLHHLDIYTAIRQIYRVLEKGGKIIFTEPNIVNPQIAAQRFIPFMRHLFYETPNERAFSRWGLKNFLSRRGFVDIVIKPYDFLHPLTPEPLIDIVDNLSRRFEKMPLMREIAGSLLIYAVKAERRIDSV
ncbi:class I SAM-dependent methyltransferase [Candidatus Omnitrophota bacterium]